jgi:hypothetical protein
MNKFNSLTEAYNQIIKEESDAAPSDSFGFGDQMPSSRERAETAYPNHQEEQQGPDLKTVLNNTIKTIQTTLKVIRSYNHADRAEAYDELQILKGLAESLYETAESSSHGNEPHNTSSSNTSRYLR